MWLSPCTERVFRHKRTAGHDQYQPQKANVMRPVEYQNGEAFTIRNYGLCLNPFRLALRHWLT